MRSQPRVKDVRPRADALGDDAQGLRRIAPKERTRVVICLGSMGVGGTELAALRTAEYLDSSQFRVTVVSLQAEGPLKQRLEASGIPLATFPINSLRGWRTIQQAIRLSRYLRRERAQIFHSQDLYGNIVGVPAARLAGIPAVLASRRWWQGTPRRGQGVVNRLCYAFAHHIVTNSFQVAKRLSDGEGVHPDRLTVIPNFVEERAFTPPPPAQRLRLLSALGLPEDAFLVGIVANLRPVKDHASLLRAAAILLPRCPSLHLALVGDGECRSGLEALARELEIGERVHFLGYQPNEPNLHHLFDVSVLCSLSEALSNSILEAMAAARPVVATATGGNKDAVVHGVTGLLVPPARPDRLAAAIEALLIDVRLRQRLGEAGQRRARQLYNSSAVISAVERLYESLLQETTPAI